MLNPVCGNYLGSGSYSYERPELHSSNTLEVK
ncbi:MAG: hypothetical protein RJA57_758, partial [Bacteroidota bacterium]